MKKLIISLTIALAVFVGYKAYADIGGLAPDTGHQAYYFQMWGCTTNSGVPVPGTCTSYYVNWVNLTTYLAANVNWVDLTGTTVTGVVSNATFLKSSAP
jgi:hypothetical protein